MEWSAQGEWVAVRKTRTESKSSSPRVSGRRLGRKPGTGGQRAGQAREGEAAEKPERRECESRVPRAGPARTELGRETPTGFLSLGSHQGRAGSSKLRFGRRPVKAVG